MVIMKLTPWVFGEPVPISAEHGDGMVDLRDAIVEAVGEDKAFGREEYVPAVEEDPRF